MMKVGLFYGSETGNTKEVASQIEKRFLSSRLALRDVPWDFSDLNLRFGLQQLLIYDVVIIGSPTWNIGELQADVAEFYSELESEKWSFEGKKIAIYGCGDQDGYPETYQDAVGIIAKKMRDLGGELIGGTEVSGNFESSQAIENGKFLGLAIDYENESDLVSSKIDHWSRQLLEEVI